LVDKANAPLSQQPKTDTRSGTTPALQDTFTQNQNYQSFANGNEGFQTNNQGNVPFDYAATDGHSSNNGELQNGTSLELFPFDGLNVEDLWNWMLVTDAIEPTDETDWLGTQILQ